MSRLSFTFYQEIKVHRLQNELFSLRRSETGQGWLNCELRRKVRCSLYCGCLFFTHYMEILVLSTGMIHLPRRITTNIPGPAASHVLLSSFFLTLCLFLSHLFSLFFQKRKSSSSVQLMVSVLCLPQC